MREVLYLDPISAPSGAIGAIEVLRSNPLGRTFEGEYVEKLLGPGSHVGAILFGAARNSERQQR
jgi:hypothetical protein